MHAPRLRVDDQPRARVCYTAATGRVILDDASYWPALCIGCFNARYRRTGTLWEGRFKSALVDGERYVLACYRYIELNPVRAGMAGTAINYRWSSHSHNACGVDEPRINPYQAYSALGATEAERQKAFQPLFDEGLSDNDADALRLATNQQKNLGQRMVSAADRGAREA